MKILFTRFPLESCYGGAEVQVLSLMEGLLERGHAVAFLGSCPTLLEECGKRNIPFAKLNIGPPPVTKWNAISFYWRKKKMQRKLEIAIKQFHDLDAVVMLSLSEKLLLTEIVNERSLVTGRSSLVVWLEHDRIGRWLKKNPWLSHLRKLSMLATTVVVSELSKNIYVKLGFNPDRVVAIPNGIDPERFELVECRMSNVECHIGCIARLTYDKGVDLLIYAIKEIPEIKLTIIGTGRDEATIKRENEKTRKRVNIIPRSENLGNFYNSLDLLVLPSRQHDPFGLVAAEAMMLGVPVIVTDACGIADYLENGVDSIIVKAGSSDAIKEGIQRLVNSEELRNKIGKAGKETAMEKFTVERMVGAYDELLKS